MVQKTDAAGTVIASRARILQGQTESNEVLIGHSGAIGLEIPDLSPNSGVFIKIANVLGGTFRRLQKEDVSGDWTVASGAGNKMISLVKLLAPFSVLKVEIGTAQSATRDFWFIVRRGDTTK